MSFSDSFYLERNPRGFVRAGVRGHGIDVLVELDPERKEEFSRDDAKWREEMDKIATQAEKEVRDLWKRRRLW